MGGNHSGKQFAWSRKRVVIRPTQTYLVVPNLIQSHWGSPNYRRGPSSVRYQYISSGNQLAW